MNHKGFLGAAFLLPALAALVIAVPQASAFDKDEAKCRKTIAKSVGKAAKTADKVIAGCHKSRNKDGALAGTDCNDMSQADTKLKFSKAAAKLDASIDKACIQSGIDNDVLDEYISCPEPCATETGVSNPLTSYADLAACLACSAETTAENVGAVILGTPTSPMASSDDQKCHGTVAKSWGKYQAAILKNRSKCQDTEEGKNGANGLDDTTCSTDVFSKITDAATKAAGSVSGACGATNIASFNLTGGCAGAVNAGDLNTCAEAEETAAGDSLFQGSYELEASGICPIRVDSLIRAGIGLSGTTQSRLDVGWKGFGHRFDVPDDYFLSADVTCPSSAPCGACTIDGISANGPQYQSFLRCFDDFTIECSNAFGNDGACPGGGLCRYVLGPPLPLSAANNPTCNINTLANDISGTANPDDGSADLNISLRTLTHLGVSQTQPCPLCSSDPIAGDGVRGGECTGGQGAGVCISNTCISGANLGGSCSTNLDCPGLPCDIQAFDETFAPAGKGVGLSLDCPPSSGQNISGSGLAIQLNLTTGIASLPFATVCDPPFPPPPGGPTCACAVCSGLVTKACASNADCTGGEGTCTTNGGGAAALRQPNNCSDLSCSDTGDGINGECQAGVVGTDIVSFCDGQLKANGDGYLFCTVGGQATCDASDPICDGGDCGNCTLQQTLPCFLDPIVAQGTADVDNPVLSGAFCLPPTGNAAINGAAGTPGPGRIWVDQVTNLVYK